MQAYVMWQIWDGIQKVVGLNPTRPIHEVSPLHLLRGTIIALFVLSG